MPRLRWTPGWSMPGSTWGPNRLALAVRGRCYLCGRPAVPGSPAGDLRAASHCGGPRRGHPRRPGGRPEAARRARGRRLARPRRLVIPSRALSSTSGASPPAHRVLMDAKHVWRAALGELQVSLSPANFETWLRNTSLVDVDDNRFRIAVPNGFAKDWLETRYRSLISQTLARIVGYSVQVEFVVREPAEDEPAGRAAERAAAPQVRVEPTRVGAPRAAPPTSTRATRSPTSSSARPTDSPTPRACRSPSGPGHAYNPLFLYGGVGLGKTHLMHAIGNAVHRALPAQARRLRDEREVHERVHHEHPAGPDRRLPGTATGGSTSSSSTTSSSSPTRSGRRRSSSTRSTRSTRTASRSSSRPTGRRSRS